MLKVLLNYYNFHEDWAFSQLSKHITKAKRVTVLPLAFRDSQAWDRQSWLSLYGKNGEKYQKILEPFLHFGLKEHQITFVDFFSYTATMKNQIENSDILLLTGGLPEKILQRLEILNLTDTLKNFKGTLLGVSAGAMVLFKNYHITPDQDYPNYVAKNQGLGLIDDFDLEVHFEGKDIQYQCIERALAENKKPIFAMWHQGGLIVDGEKITVLGSVDTHGTFPKNLKIEN